MDRHPVAHSAMHALLATVVVGGALTISAATPGILSAWSSYAARKKREKKQRYQQMWLNFHRLKKERSLICRGEENGQMIYELTSKGDGKVKKFLLDTLEIVPPRRWDGMWRVVMFDIPIRKRKSVRDSFRRKLQELGFYQFQRSVWVHPFPCETEIEFLKDYHRLGSCVTVWRSPEAPSGRVLYYFKDVLKQMA